mgnify:CR=1 FL=1
MLTPASVVPVFDALIAAKTIRIAADADISDAIATVEKIAGEEGRKLKPADIDTEVQTLRAELAKLAADSTDPEALATDVSKLEAELEAAVKAEAEAAATVKAQAAASAATAKAQASLERASATVAAAGQTAVAARKEAQAAKLQASESAISAAKVKIDAADAEVKRLEAEYQALDAECAKLYKTRNEADKARDQWDVEIQKIEARLAAAKEEITTAPVSSVPPDIIAASLIVLRYTKEHPDDGTCFCAACGIEINTADIDEAIAAHEKLQQASGPDLSGIESELTDAQDERAGWAKDAAEAATAYAKKSEVRAKTLEAQDKAEKALKVAREELRLAAITKNKLNDEE